jgi:hypothetical protein
MASPVTSIPVRSNSPSSARAAVISLPPGGTAAWPSTSRASQAKAVTTCSGDAPAAQSNDRRSVLPSIATTPRPSWPRPSRNRPKQAPKAAGSSSRNSRLNVSWLGRPFSSFRKLRNSRSRSRAKSAKSTQLSAPQTEATSAIVTTSTRSCRVAFPVRGSGNSAKHASNQPIGPLQPRSRYKNPSRRVAGIPHSVKCDSRASDARPPRRQ